MGARSTEIAHASVPRIPNATLSRRGLLARLDAADACRLVLVSAPAGSGKSALLAEWVGRRDQPVAWLSCREDDADPGAFWRHLADAVVVGLGGHGLVGTEVLDDGANPADALARQLSSVSGPATVVIDDLHLAGVAPKDLVALIGGLPRAVTLVLSTRVDPPFSLARLRVQGDLLELRQGDLRLDLDETARVLSSSGLQLADDEVARIHALTEGWPAGVHLLGLALRDGGRVEALTEMVVSDPDLAEFLLAEVVDQQPEDLREFLMVTAELGSFAPDLVDAVTGRDDGAEQLARVRSRNLFLVEAGGGTGDFRYHHLFQEFLRHRLRAQGGDRRAAVLRAAAAHHLATGERSAAIQRFLDAGEVDGAREILAAEVAAGSSHLEGSAAAARRWLAEHGEAQLLQDPSGFLECSISLHAGGYPDEAEYWLRRWQDREPDLAHAPRVLLHGALAHHHVFVGDPERALSEGMRAAELLAAQPIEGGWLEALPVLLAQAMISLSMVDEARDLLDRARANPSVPPPIALNRIPGFAAHVELEAGDLARAEEFARRALDAADALGLPDGHFGRAEPELVLTAVAVEQADLAAAESHLERTLRIAEFRRPQIEYLAHLEGARLATLRSEPAGAVAAIERAVAAQPRAATPVRARIARVAAECAVDLGEPEAATPHVASLPPGAARSLVEARLALARGDGAGARDHLASLGEDLHPTDAVIGALVGAAALPRVDRPRAVEVSAGALVAAAQLGLVRTVVALGPQVWDLLAESPATGAVARHRDRILEVARAAVPPAGSAAVHGAVGLAERLTERELTVLRYLASRLDSAEIAAALYLSVNTVRSHVKAVYRKLEVGSRADAVARARDLGLL